MPGKAYEPLAEKGLISIGALAHETGLSPATLRVWERRYGQPVPVRLPSGHRRYREKDIPWLRGVSEALAHGHRPSALLKMSLPQLEALLGGLAPRVDELLERLLEAVRSFDHASLETELYADWENKQPILFLEQTLGPFLETLGRSWASGEIEVRHEHCASEVVTAFLHARRAELPEPVLGRGKVVLSTLSGERHGLGLQALALVCALEGVPCSILGVDTPNVEIASAAVELGADRVAVSISLATGGPETDRRLRDLRESLPSVVDLIAGGAGARRGRRGVAGVRYVRDLRSFATALNSST